MSTRSTIKIEAMSSTGRKTSKRLYHHHDGYPEGVGRDLKTRLATLADDEWTLNSVKDLIQQEAHYEDTTSIHGDEEYFYLVSCITKTVTCWEIPGRLRFEDEEYESLPSRSKESLICVDENLREITDQDAETGETVEETPPATFHIKLENGDLTVVNDDYSESTIDKIRAVLKSIVEGDDQTCFVFANDNGFIRFYLDNNGRPMTRLLTLLCSKLTKLRDGVVDITSVKNGRPCGSRLHLTFVADGIEGEAPYNLSSTSFLRNPERIGLIRNALELVAVDTAEAVEALLSEGQPVATQGETVRNISENPERIDGETVETTVGDLSGHAPVVVGGLSGPVATYDSREVALVRGYSIAFAMSGFPREDRESAADYLVRLAGMSHEIHSRTFVTQKERAAFKDGVSVAFAAVNSLMTLTFVEERDEVNRVLQAIADNQQ